METLTDPVIHALAGYLSDVAVVTLTVIPVPSPPPIVVEAKKGFFAQVAEDMRKMCDTPDGLTIPELGLIPELTPRKNITNIGGEPGKIPYTIPREGIPHSPNDLEKEDLKKLMSATKSAKQACHQIVPCAAKFALEPDNRKYKEDLQALTIPIMEFAAIGTLVSQAALKVGGHGRTWKGVGAVAQGAMSVGTSLNMLSAAGPGLSLGALTGGIGLAIGVMGIAMALFNDNDDDNELGEALQAIHGAVIAVHEAVIEMRKEMVVCFQRMEELLIVSVVAQLNQINSRIGKLERIMMQSFKELHTKELIDTVDAIKKEICKEHELTTTEKKTYLRQLSSWIDNHSKSYIQTQSHRIDGDMLKVIELLTETNLIESLPLFLSELMCIIPELELDGLDNLPNLDVLSIACDVYILASKRSGYGMSNPEVIKRARTMLDNVDRIIEVLKSGVIGDETCCDILCRQYDHFRFTVGQVICKIRGTETWTGTTPLCDYLKEGQDKVLLIGLLNEMEVRRLCIVRLRELLGTSAVALESKSEILYRPVCEYNQGFMTKVFKDDEVGEFKRCVEMGTNQNTWDSWGSPLHYMTKYSTTSMFIHLLFKTCSPTIMTGGTKYCKGDTWGVGSSPILHALNCSLSNMAILFCANGFDILDSNGKTSGFGQFNSSHMGNLYSWVERGYKPAIITLRIVKKMNDNTSEWNKINLRAAYRYFKLCESALPCSTDGFNMESLLLLTCVIGDLFPLKYYLSKTQTVISADFLSALIPNLGVTYILLANDWKQPFVLEYLESLCVVQIMEEGLNVRDVNQKENPSSGPVWKIGTSKSLAVVGRSRLNEYLNDTKLKIDMYLETDSLPPVVGTKIMEDCRLFKSLLIDVVKTTPANNKYAGYINTNMMLLEDGINAADYQIIRNALNCINAILSSIPGYSLRDTINNLIDDIKLMAED